MAVTLVHIADSTSYYSFTAQSLTDAQGAMSRLGPRDGDGHHAASCDVQADIMQGLQTGIVAGSTVRIAELGVWTATAHITQAQLRYRAVYRYPQWTNVARLARYVRNEWQRFMRCLRLHERGHLTAVMPALRRSLRQFQGLRIAATGASGSAAEAAAQRDLRVQAQDLSAQLQFNGLRASRTYDRRTRHGRSQGARLRTGSRRRSRRR